jgi:hypothetical protein
MHLTIALLSEVCYKIGVGGESMSEAQKRGMMGVIKKFDRADHIQYDKLGRDSMREFINKMFAGKDLKTIDNPDAYGIDLLTLNSKDEVVHCWEIEVRHGNWQGDIKFPFGEINCIERKDHQWRREESFTKKIPFKLAEHYGVSYVQLNKECTRAVVIDSRKILEYPLKPWANRKSDGEYVRQVPITECIQVKVVS